MREFKYFLDSNIFLRPIIKDDLEKVKDCEILFEEIEKGKTRAFTSNLILGEIVWVSQGFYKIKKEEIIKILRGILDLKNLKIIDNFNPRLALEIYEKHPVKFIDTLIASIPTIFQKKVIVVSYDKDFDKIGVKRMEPGKIIKK